MPKWKKKAGAIYIYASPFDSYQQENVIGNNNEYLLIIKRETGREARRRKERGTKEGGMSKRKGNCREL